MFDLFERHNVTKKCPIPPMIRETICRKHHVRERYILKTIINKIFVLIFDIYIIIFLSISKYFLGRSLTKLSRLRVGKLKMELLSV